MSKKQLNEMKKFMQVMEGEAPKFCKDCGAEMGEGDDSFSRMCAACNQKGEDAHAKLDEECEECKTWDLEDQQVCSNCFGAYTRPELFDDENDARGKMCSVCSGGRREGYGNTCPNCNGEGYVTEDYYDKDMEYFDVLIKHKDEVYWDQQNSEALPRDVALDWADDYTKSFYATGTVRKVTKGRTIIFKCYYDKNGTDLGVIVKVELADPADYLEDDISLDSVVESILEPVRRPTVVENETSTNLPKGFEVVDEDDDNDGIIDDEDIGLDNLSINVELDD